jgi:hypothetical protein
MITTIEVPHLADGQKKSDYKKVFVAATATLKDPERRACIPLYVHRTEGERRLAFTASGKETTDAAFKFLEDLIDGKPCVFTECTKFFCMMPENTSLDSIRSYFFELHEVATRAEIPNDVCVKRFLTNVPGGKKLYDENTGRITTAELNTTDKVTEFFKTILPKLKKKYETGDVSPMIKDEPFVFPIQQGSGKNEDIPNWAWDLKEQVNDIRSRMESNESGFAEEEHGNDNKQVLAFNDKHTKKGISSRKSCEICGKSGHVERNCFQRICLACNGKGHDADVCPSKSNRRKSSQFKSNSTSSQNNNDRR